MFLKIEEVYHSKAVATGFKVLASLLPAATLLVTNDLSANAALVDQTQLVPFASEVNENCAPNCKVNLQVQPASSTVLPLQKTFSSQPGKQGVTQEVSPVLKNSRLIQIRDGREINQIAQNN
ncbi:hypothetical protein [Anabaena sp. AL09]|jgi:hypothetical protein|uniref:hypothetical protein n=1 Tax=Anabaena sp. AL09 TaxID=1710891 RepID=UPI0008005B11|nr:hypothetical protein [Anabaena sp. AL09]OBQ13629.1 MAG: hypothetical protein AN490_02435 [Anabaena sp. AL09]